MKKSRTLLLIIWILALVLGPILKIYQYEYADYVLGIGLAGTAVWVGMMIKFNGAR